MEVDQERFDEIDAIVDRIVADRPPHEDVARQVGPPSWAPACPDYCGMRVNRQPDGFLINRS
jgi:hypothetical protein